MPEINSEDLERVGMLEIVSSSKTGLKILSKEQLSRLYVLVKDRDYTHNIETEKSKKELLEKITNRLYDLEEGRVILFLIFRSLYYEYNLCLLLVRIVGLVVL